MAHFIFILLIFLNFAQPQNSQKIPSEFILNYMKTFIVVFEDDLIKFVEKIGKIVGKKSLQEMGHPFVEALIRKEFLSEFQKMKKNVEEYLKKENGNFEEIVAELNKLKLAEGKLNALKKLKDKIRNGENIQKKIPGGIPREIPRKISEEIPKEIPVEIPNEKRLELINDLISLREILNKFVDKTKLELQIGIPQKNFNKLAEIIQRNGQTLEGIFEELFEKNKENAYKEIWHIILEKKRTLGKIFKKGNRKFNKGISVETNLGKILKKNSDKLKAVIDIENPLWEEVELNEYPEHLPKGVPEIVHHYEQIGVLIEETYEKLPKLIENASFFKNKQKEYAHFRQFQWLNNANNEIFHRISLLGGNDPKLVEDYHLADIRYLAEYIKEKLNEISEMTNFNNKIAIVNRKKQLAEEWEKIILNTAQNLLALSGRLEKIHKIDEAISRIINPSDGREKVHRMIERKTVPENVGIFFYNKYLEFHTKKTNLMENNKENEATMPLGNIMPGEHNALKLSPYVVNQLNVQSKQLYENETEEEKKAIAEHARERIGKLVEIGGNVQPNDTKDDGHWITVWPEHPKGPKLANKRRIFEELNSAKKKGKMILEIPKNIPENLDGMKTNKKPLKSKYENVVESKKILLKSGDIGVKKLSHSKMENILGVSNKIVKNDEEVEGEEIVYKSADKMASSDSTKNTMNLTQNAVPSAAVEQSEEILWESNPSKYAYAKNNGIGEVNRKMQMVW